jgi:DNA-binding LytR/AlgR family response regulator
MRVLLADDEPLAILRLRALLAEMPEVEVVGAAQDADEAAALIEVLQPDLVFLDVEMPGRSGVALAMDLAEDSQVAVIFVTAYERFAADAFELGAVDYLLKPVKPQRLRLALDRAARLKPQASRPPFSSYATTLWVPRREGLARVEVETIDWIEAAGDYVLLHVGARQHMLRTTMDALQQKLDPDAMPRVSRSAFVRRSAVVGVRRLRRNGLALTLANQTLVPVGYTYVHEVSRLFGLRGRADARADGRRRA